MAREWTPEQKQCIYATEGTLLVSAAAGSGKTTVLVERILQRITRPEAPSDIDRLLVVTFTKAAAAEMKQRLQTSLTAYMAESPNNRRLLKQQMLLPRASISTIHGFCTTLLREHFFRLDLSPNFAVAEESQTAPLMQQALSEVIEAAYAAGDFAFLELTELIGSGKDDQKLFAEIVRLYRFVQSHPFPEEWLEQMSARYHDTAPLEETALGKQLRAVVLNGLEESQTALRTALNVCAEDKALSEHYISSLSSSLLALNDCAEQLPKAPFNEWAALLSAVPFPKFSAARGADAARKTRVSALRDRVKKDILGGRLLPLLSDTAEEFAEDRTALAPLVDCLCRLVLDFSARFAEKKRAKRLVDFNDLEHFALHLLVEKKADGTLERTPLATELCARFDEVLVDEYQDTNATQDALFAALSRDGNNLFMVGDVKQSIYGFRQAMPEIFVSKRDAFPRFDGTQYPATIMLGNNFRSRHTVTNSVNFFFSRLMQRPLGGIAYAEGEALIAGASYPEAEGYETELMIVDQAEREVQDSRDAAEARAIARRIQEMMPTLSITEKGVTRAAQYGDFCVLLRSKNAHAAAYAETFEQLGVPVWTSSAGGFFASYEISVALSLLRVIDNPMQDVPLLALLCSPLGGFSPDDLAEIREKRRKGGLYSAVRAYSLGETPLAARCRMLLTQVDRYRTLAATMPADRLLTRIYDETGLMGLMSARAGGAGRQANLRLLLDLSRRFEQDGFKGLSAFIRHIDRMTRQKQDVAPASVASHHADAVRIMSIHNSKGLEFPVVFVAGLGMPFNREDLHGTLLMHPTAGLGLMRQEIDTHKRYDTLLRKGVALTMKEHSAAEELRVLYVAMTRAKEKLCLVVSVKNAERTLTRLGASLDSVPQLSISSIANASSMGDWVLSAALQHPDAGELRALAGLSAYEIPYAEEPPGPLAVSVLPVTAATVTVHTENAVETAADPVLTEQLKERFAYTYPYAALGAVPAKLAASHMAHRGIDTAHIAHARPAFMSTLGLTPAERGTALHAFLQFCDPLKARRNPQEEAQSLVARGFLTAVQAEALEMPKLKAFLSDPLFERMCNAVKLRREFPFAVTLSLDALDPAVLKLLPADAASETVVVQGIVDCVFEENGHLVLVDYKTDRGVSDTVLRERYAPQLTLYRRALEEILELPVEETYLYSLALSKAILLE